MFKKGKKSKSHESAGVAVGDKVRIGSHTITVDAVLAEGELCLPSQL